MSVRLYVSVHLYVCVWQVQIRQCVPEHLLCMCTCLGLYTRSGLYTCMCLNTCLCVWQVQIRQCVPEQLLCMCTCLGLYTRSGLYTCMCLNTCLCVWQVQIRQCVSEHLLCMCTCLGLYTCMRLNTCLCVWQVQMQIHKGEKNTQKTVAYIRDQGWVRAVALFPPACRSSVLSTNSSAVTAHSAFLFPTTASPRPL